MDLLVWAATSTPDRRRAEFQNRLLAEICHHLRTRTALTTAYHPQANGMIERTNRVVKDALAATVAESPQEWEQMVPQVRLALNSAFHRSIQETPLYLLTGQEAHFPVGLTNLRTTDQETDFARQNRTARRVAAETAEAAKTRWMADYNVTSAPPRAYGEGDLVLWRDHVTRYGDRKILNVKWADPGRVLKTSGQLVVWVRATTPPYRERQLHMADT